MKLPPKTTDPKIYRMELHEEIKEDNWFITRVPGGWIYRRYGHSDSVFVPFNKEFKKKKTSASPIGFSGNSRSS